MKFQDMGRSARIELAKMAKQLGMKYIGYNPTAQQVSLEYKGKGLLTMWMSWLQPTNNPII